MAARRLSIAIAIRGSRYSGPVNGIGALSKARLRLPGRPQGNPGRHQAGSAAARHQRTMRWTRFMPFITSSLASAMPLVS